MQGLRIFASVAMIAMVVAACAGATVGVEDSGTADEPTTEAPVITQLEPTTEAPPTEYGSDHHYSCGVATRSRSQR